MALSLRQINYFDATVDARQISAAAANLNVSQSAVTAAIKALEGELEARLFDRHSNGVSLTYEGHQFLPHAHNIVAAVSAATRAPRRLWLCADHHLAEREAVSLAEVAAEP